MHLHGLNRKGKDSRTLTSQQPISNTISLFIPWNVVNVETQLDRGHNTNGDNYQRPKVEVKDVTQDERHVE